MGKISPTDMRNALLMLPTGSDAYDYAYDATMERICGQVADHGTLALNTLLWVTCSMRPLTVPELQHALAVELGKVELDLGKLSPIKIITSVCAGPVIVDENTSIVRLVYYTAQEYFERTQGQWFPGVESIITSICTTYLSFSVFGKGPCITEAEFDDQLISYPLYCYASNNWGHHARYSTALDPGVLEFLFKAAQVEASTQILTMDKVYIERDLSRYSQYYVRQMTGLHVAAYFGLEQLVGDLLRREVRTNAKDCRGGTPLWWAAKRGHKGSGRTIAQKL